MSHNRLCKPWEHALSRRQWLGATAAASAGAMGLGNLLEPAVAAEVIRQRKQVLFVWTDGGMSQLESWDPKPGTRFGGPFRAIDTSVPGIQLCELLPRCAKIMDKLSIVRSLCTQDNSHSAGVARIQRGDPKNRGVTYPFFGSAVAKLLGPGDSGLPPYVWIKPLSGGFVSKDAGFLGPKYGALAFGDGKPPENMSLPELLTPQDDDDRNELRESLNQRYAANRRAQSSDAHGYVYDVGRTLMKRTDLFNEDDVSPRDRERYGAHELGRHMRQGLKMLEAGVTFVKVNSYGWDTHGDHFNGAHNLHHKFDQAFASIVEDLDDRGMLDQVLVVAIAEFGRTPRINGHIGRDHWPEAWSAVTTGCGINRGLVVGKTNKEGTWVEGDQHDIGHLFHTWFHAIGIDSSRIEYDNHGQPLPLAHDDMGPIRELLA